MNQESKKAEQKLIFVFSIAVIKLQVKYRRKFFLLQKNLQKDINSEVTIMWPPVNVNKSKRSSTVYNCPCHMSS